MHVQAADLSLMLRKSVEARDWLSAVEPRSVRAVMKRVVEDVTLVDAQVKGGIIRINLINVIYGKTLDNHCLMFCHKCPVMSPIHNNRNVTLPKSSSH